VSIINSFSLLPLFYSDEEKPDQDYFTFSKLSLQADELHNNTIIWIVFFLTIVYSLAGHIATFTFGKKSYKYVPK